MCLAVPVKVINIVNEKKVKVSHQGVQLEVSSMLFPDIKIDDYVLIHAGFIIQKIADEEVEKTLQTFEEYQQLLKKK